MAPRIANDCFPDELLTVDYDTIGPVGMGGIGVGVGMGGGGGGGGGPQGGTTTHDVNVDEMNFDNGGTNNNNAAAAAVAAAAVAMADEELNVTGGATVGTQTTNNTNGNNTTNSAAGGGGGDQPQNSIENDPLSMGHPSIAHSHSSISGGGGMNGGGIHQQQQQHDVLMQEIPTNTTMGTTITVTMAQAAQQAWDVFVAGQENNQQVQVPMAMDVGGGRGVGISFHDSNNNGGGGGGYSPSSMPQAASPSTASLAAQHHHHHHHPFQASPTQGNLGPNLNNDTTPMTYQELMLQQQQQRQDLMMMNGIGGNSNGTVHSAPASVTLAAAADRMAMAAQQGLRAAIPGRPVPRASSFGGFPVSSSRGTSSGGGENAPLAPTLEELAVDHHHQRPSTVSPHPVGTVSRSASVTSSLTASNAGGGGSVHSSTSTYQRFLSSFNNNNSSSHHHQQQEDASSPLETIPPSDNEGSSPGEQTFASIHQSSPFSLSPASATATSSSPATETDDSKLSPSSGGEGNSNSYTNSPKLPYSPSLLDQTTSDDLSLDDDDDDDDGNDKYSPISKLHWNEEKDDTGMDTTADTTMEEDSPIKTTSQVGVGLASHVIHEDSTLMDGGVPTSTSLRPRPSPFARADSTSGSGSTHGNVSANGIRATTVGGIPQGSRGLLVRNEAFETSPNRPQYRHQISDVSVASNDGSVQLHVTPPPLSFGSETTISDLTYYAEKGCIVDVLAALTNPYLKTLGSRMLADYAKMPNRRVAVASNTKILEFVQSTALEIGMSGTSGSYEHVSKYTSPTWLGREYAVETVRSLTAAEENDGYLMNSPGLLQMLALVARGGPFVQNQSTTSSLGSIFSLREPVIVAVPPPIFADNGSPGPRLMTDNTMGVASDKARLHACIAIMNLSCGKSNKIEITSVKEILEGMRDVMLGRHFATQPRSSLSSTRASTTLADEARLKATTCIKNLSNADANDAALLATPGLVETLGYVAEATCHPKTGATTCTTHACLALMNLSISKANKNRVFRTPGVMDALMAVITRTAPKANAAATADPPNPKDPNFEARVKACSALSNLAIGYDNKIPMFNYPGFVESILTVIKTDKAEARTKACSILWSFAAEMKNQVPVVQRGDILPALVSVAKEDTKTEARFKCVAALTLLAESPENAVPLLKAGSLEPLMNVLQEAGPDPTQWRGQTASWCVGFLMNMAQCDDVVPALLQEGIVDLLAPLLSLDHYQSLKAAMAVTFVCQYDTGDKTYNLLRQTENVIPKIVGLLHNTLSGRGGSGYKYGVFTLRSSVGCIASLAAGPDFMKERIATDPVFESLLKVVEDFCVDGGTPGAIVGGGKDDTRSVTLAVRALSSLIGHLIPEPNCAAMPFGPAMDDQLITALGSFEQSTNPDIDDVTRKLAYEARIRVEGGKNLHRNRKDSVSSDSSPDDLSDDGGGIGLSLAQRFFPFPCGINLHVPSDPAPTPALPMSTKDENTMDISDDAASAMSDDGSAVRTFLLTDSKTGRRFAVPCDPSGGRQFNDNRVWCFRRGRYCNEGEMPDSNFTWSDELQAAYKAALNGNESLSEC